MLGDGAMSAMPMVAARSAALTEAVMEAAARAAATVAAWRVAHEHSMAVCEHRR